MTLDEIQHELDEGRAVVVNKPWIAVTILDAVQNLPEHITWEVLLSRGRSSSQNPSTLDARLPAEIA